MQIVSIHGVSNETHRKEPFLAGGWFLLEKDQNKPLLEKFKQLPLFKYFKKCNIFMIKDVHMQVVAGINYRISCLIERRCTTEQFFDDFNERRKHGAGHCLPCRGLCFKFIVKVFIDLHPNMTACSDDQKYKNKTYVPFDDSRYDLD